MKPKRCLILVAIALFLFPFVNSAVLYDNDTSLKFWLPMNDSSGNLRSYAKAYEQSDFTSLGNPTYQQQGIGFSPYSIYFDGDDDGFINTSLDLHNQFGGNITIAGLMVAEGTPASYSQFMTWDEAYGTDWNGGKVYIYTQTAGTNGCTAPSDFGIGFWKGDGLSTFTCSETSPTTYYNEPICFVATISEDGGVWTNSVYVNGTLIDSYSPSFPYSIQPTESDGVAIGVLAVSPTNQEFKGKMSNVAMWSKALNSSEISDYCTNGIADSSPSPDLTSPLITLVYPTPENMTFIDHLDIVFNITIVETNLDTIVFNFNGTEETNTFNNDFGNYWSLTKVISSEGTYTYSLFVNDTAGNSYQSGTYTFFVDNVMPVIIYTFPSPSNNTNHNSTGNVDILGYNINLRNGTLNVYNSTEDLIYTNFTEIIGSSFPFVDSMEQIFSAQPDGYYKFHTCFVDVVSLEMCQDVQMLLNNTPYYIQPEVVPTTIPSQIVETLSESGQGLGTFLDTIKRPLGNFIFYIAIIGGVVAIVLGFGTVLKSKFERI